MGKLVLELSKGIFYVFGVELFTRKQPIWSLILEKCF